MRSLKPKGGLASWYGFVLRAWFPAAIRRAGCAASLTPRPSGPTGLSSRVETEPAGGVELASYLAAILTITRGWINSGCCRL
jgi:hypothetical protein